jgi:hypothetical protein
MPQGSPLVQSDMIRSVAFDLVLWIVRARVVDIPFVVNIPGVHAHDATPDPASFGIPTDVVTNVEYLRHAEFPSLEAVSVGLNRTSHEPSSPGLSRRPRLLRHSVLTIDVAAT